MGKESKLEEITLLRINDIIPKLLPISKSHWWAGVKDGRFPQPVKLSERCTMWRLSDIQKLVKHGQNWNKH